MKNKLFLKILCFTMLSITIGNIGQELRAQDNEAVVHTFFKSLNEHDVDELVALFTDDCLYEEVASGRTYTNKQAITSYIGSTLSGIPDSEFEVTELISTESFGVAEWIWKGTNSVGWPHMDIHPTDKYFELRGISFLEIVNGKIKRVSDYWDWNSFIQGISQ